MPGREPTVIIDLDGTILDRRLGESLRLYLIRSPRTGRIFPGADESLRRLRESADIVAVTARCARGEANTRLWLERHDLAFIPALHSPCFLTNEPARVVFKTKAIKSLRDEGHTPVIGVGDRGSDLDAYLDTGLFPVMVSDRPGKRLQGLQKRIEQRGLIEGLDYLLLRTTPEAPPLWVATEQAILERLGTLA